MSRGGFNFKEFRNMYQQFSEMQSQFDSWLEDFLLKEALRALRLVRPLTPVKTGNLRRHWSISDITRNGDALEVHLVNPVEYASHMEYGFTYQAKVGEGHFEGFHMAEISIIQVRNSMPARFEASFTRWLRTLNGR